MINHDEAIIRRLSYFPLALPSDAVYFDDEKLGEFTESQSAFLRKLFLHPFSSTVATFEFRHEIDLSYNVLFNTSRQIYQDADFQSSSDSIRQYLQSVSTHPNINPGDFFVVAFEGIFFEGKYYEGVGCYKFDERAEFLEPNDGGSKPTLEFRRGFGGRKPDKSCLIIFTAEPYTVLVNESNSNQTDFWQNSFLDLDTKDDDINDTANFLALAKDYVTSESRELGLSRPDQIDLLNRTVGYFKGHDKFDRNEFEQSVFDDPNVANAFRGFGKKYQDDRNLAISDAFQISPYAVKRQARIFRAILKLDKNFHIYIHGDRDMIEQGVDREGRKYYKLYYEHES